MTTLLETVSEESSSCLMEPKSGRLCDLCGVTRTHFGVNPITSRYMEGTYDVYKGYCLGPKCHRLSEVRELLNEPLKKAALKKLVYHDTNMSSQNSCETETSEETEETTPTADDDEEAPRDLTFVISDSGRAKVRIWKGENNPTRATSWDLHEVSDWSEFCSNECVSANDAQLPIDEDSFMMLCREPSFRGKQVTVHAEHFFEKYEDPQPEECLMSRLEDNRGFSFCSMSKDSTMMELGDAEIFTINEEENNDQDEHRSPLRMATKTLKGNQYVNDNEFEKQLEALVASRNRSNMFPSSPSKSKYRAAIRRSVPTAAGRFKVLHHSSGNSSSIDGCLSPSVKEKSTSSLSEGDITSRSSSTAIEKSSSEDSMMLTRASPCEESPNCDLFDSLATGAIEGIPSEKGNDALPSEDLNCSLESDRSFPGRTFQADTDLCHELVDPQGEGKIDLDLTTDACIHSIGDDARSGPVDLDNSNDSVLALRLETSSPVDLDETGEDSIYRRIDPRETTAELARKNSGIMRDRNDSEDTEEELSRIQQSVVSRCVSVDCDAVSLARSEAPISVGPIDLDEVLDEFQELHERGYFETPPESPNQGRGDTHHLCVPETPKLCATAQLSERNSFKTPPNVKTFENARPFTAPRLKGSGHLRHSSAAPVLEKFMDIPNLGNTYVTGRVLKRTKDVKTGIAFKRLSDGSIIISKIKKNGLFHSTSLEVGDQVASINDHNCHGKECRTVAGIVKNTQGLVSIVALRMRESGELPNIVSTDVSSSSRKSSSTSNWKGIDETSSVVSDITDVFGTTSPPRHRRDMSYTSALSKSVSSSKSKQRAEDDSVNSSFTTTTTNVGDKSFVLDSASSFLYPVEDPSYRHAINSGVLWLTLVGQHVRFPATWFGGARSPYMGVTNLLSPKGEKVPQHKWIYIAKDVFRAEPLLNEFVPKRSSPGRILMHIIIRDEKLRPVQDVALGCYHPYATALTAEKGEDKRVLWMAIRRRSGHRVGSTALIDPILMSECRLQDIMMESPIGRGRHRIHNHRLNTLFGSEPPVRTLFISEKELVKKVQNARKGTYISDFKPITLLLLELFMQWRVEL